MTNYNRHPNQYSQSDPRGLYLMIGIGLIAASLWIYGEVNIIKSMEPISPMGTMIVKAQEQAPQPTTRPLTIENYIEDKFGDDADKAMLLLQGEGCSENKLLSPQAVNDNRTWGGVGRDRGYWQINDVYHPSVSDWCASDIKCSTDYAYRMYSNDGKSFKRWTCGRYHGL